MQLLLTAAPHHLLTTAICHQHGYLPQILVRGTASELICFTNSAGHIAWICGLYLYHRCQTLICWNSTPLLERTCEKSNQKAVRCCWKVDVLLGLILTGTQKLCNWVKKLKYWKVKWLHQNYRGDLGTEPRYKLFGLKIDTVLETWVHFWLYHFHPGQVTHFLSVSVLFVKMRVVLVLRIKDIFNCECCFKNKVLLIVILVWWCRIWDDAYLPFLLPLTFTFQLNLLWWCVLTCWKSHFCIICRSSGLSESKHWKWLDILHSELLERI